MEYKHFAKMIDNVSALSVIFLCIAVDFCAHGLCRNTCHCSNYTMFCKRGEIPTYIPPEIRELFIEQFDFTQFNGSQFQNVSNIQKLDIQADHGTFIPSKSFDQFMNLTYLGVHGVEIRYISPDAFLGLNNCLALNLSSNPSLDIDEISRALNSEYRRQSKQILPSLVSLSVAKIKTTFPNPVDLDGFFFKSISVGRHLKYLDISDLNIFILDFFLFEQACKSVEYVDISKSVIGNAKHFMDAEPCESLRTIDLSRAVIPALRFKFSFQTLNFFCQSLKFYTYIENLLANNINNEHYVDITDYTLNMSTCPLHLKKVWLVGNKIRWMNMTVLLHEITQSSLAEINFSYNALEYISPLVLLPSENIHILDFSNNKLVEMQEKYTKEFETLFWAQTKLLYLNFSHNSLSQIPTQMFKNTKSLKTLDISYNRIHSLDFSIKHLIKLEKLFAGHNKIHNIEPNVQVALQILQTSADSGDKKYFYVYLEANEFQCSCDSENKQLIEWLHFTEVIAKNEKVTCMLDENVVNIRDTALEETKHFCKMQIVKKIATISTPILVVVVILGIMAFVHLKKRGKKKRMIRNVITQIELGTFPLEHLAFLSYCSEDTDLVLKEIYPKLCKHLSEITNSSKELVCVGDKCFRPGFALREEVWRCVEQSSVFIAVISRKFCGKSWCNLEIGLAYDLKKPIIMLMTEYVERELMDYFLQKIFDRYTHATWRKDQKNGGHVEPEWKIFCKSIIQLSGKESTEKAEDAL